MTFGTFDYLHAGHEYYLREAKKLGDELITVIARDETVRSVKGENPDNNEVSRKRTLEESGLCDTVIFGNLGDKYEVVRKHKPHIICLGYDQYAFTQKLQKAIIDSKMDTKIVRLASFQPEQFKSTIIKQLVK